MSRWNLGWLLGISAITLIGLSLSYSAPGQGSTLQTKHKNVSLLIDIMEEVQHKYVKKLDDKKMREFVENMVNGGLQQLDPHSGYINPEEYQQFQKHSKGRFGGVGIRIVKDRTGVILVESPIQGTPAYNAGVMAGDIILKIDGVSTENMTMKKVVERIQGEPGEKVTLTVLHEGAKETTDIDIVRDIIRIDSVQGDLPLENNEKKWEYFVDKEDKIAYIRISAFTETTVAELTREVEDLQKQGMNGLIVDLRNNPGGLLRSAVEVSSMFLPHGKMVVSTKGRNQSEQFYRSSSPGGFRPVQDVPMVILLNRYSASASEIVAAALRDHLRAIIIGERSYGKGSVQNVIMLEDGRSALKLTTASYWRPNGKNIHRFPDSKKEDDWGVKPNKGFKVELTDEERIAYFTYRRERDVVGKKKEEKKSDEEKEFKDRVLEKGLKYLRVEIKKNAQAGNLQLGVPQGIGGFLQPEMVIPQPAPNYYGLRDLGVWTGRRVDAVA